MRFRAKITDPGGVVRLTQMVHTMSKVSKECVLRLTPSRLHFVLSKEGGPSSSAQNASKVWSEITKDSIFGEYRIESKHPNNEILVSLGLDHLNRALKTAHGAVGVVIKMSKRGDAPNLSMEIHKLSSTQKLWTVSQDVPISVMSHELTSQYVEPDLPQPEVSINLPLPKVLRNIVDRMKALDHYVTIAANLNGQLNFRVETNTVNVTTYFRGLENPKWREGQEPEVPRDVHAMAEARIDIRKFSQFLYGSGIQANTVICSIVEGKAIILFVLTDETSLIYYIPASST